MRDNSFNKLVQLLEAVEPTLNPYPPRIEKEDHEVRMGYSQIESIMRNAKAIHDILKSLPEDTNLEAWAQSKLTMADDYLVSVADFMRTEYDHDNQAADMNMAETENPPGNPTDEEAPTAPGNFTT